jgi:hypothetical protein
MDKQTFLGKIQSGRAQWDTLLADIPQARMTSPGVAGDWSIKDIIAHIAWHEQQMVGVLQAHAFVGSDLWNLPLDQRNAAIYEQNRQRPLDDVLTEARRVFQQLAGLLELLTDDDLNDPSHFPGMPPTWQPWDVIAGNTYKHYQQHTASVEAWLAQKKTAC